MKSGSHILVTGAPRSGTTFLGHVLAYANDVGYVREPLNADFGLAGLPHQFLYMYDGMPEQAHYDGIIKKLLVGRPKFKRLSVRNASSKKQRVGRILFGSGSHYTYVKARYNPAVKRFLLKDPMAPFASQYMAEKYGVKVVVIVRHPIPLIASMRRVNLDHALDDLVRQTELYNRYLKDILGSVKLDRLSSLERRSLLWACVYYTLHRTMEDNDSFITVRHEDVSADPQTAVPELYERLGLHFTPAVATKLHAMTQGNNPGRVASNKMHVLYRNSREIVSQNYCRFDPGEERIVHSITDDVIKLYYPTVDWPQQAIGASLRSAGANAKRSKKARFAPSQGNL